jgi:hypothetical protein
LSPDRISDDNDFFKKADIIDDGSLMVAAAGLDVTIDGSRASDVSVTYMSQNQPLLRHVVQVRVTFVFDDDM